MRGPGTRTGRPKELRRSLLMRPAGPNAPYVSTMEFDSQEDFRAWMRSESFAAAHATTRGAPGMQAPSAIEPFTVVEGGTA
jgi:heme-degrading monooxygenase HmoA